MRVTESTTLSDVLKEMALPTDLKQIIGRLYVFNVFNRGPVFAGSIVGLYWPRPGNQLHLTTTEGVICMYRGINVEWLVREFRQNGSNLVRYEGDLDLL